MAVMSFGIRYTVLPNGPALRRVNLMKFIARAFGPRQDQRSCRYRCCASRRYSTPRPHPAATCRAPAAGPTRQLPAVSLLSSTDVGEAGARQTARGHSPGAEGQRTATPTVVASDTRFRSACGASRRVLHRYSPLANVLMSDPLVTLGCSRWEERSYVYEVSTRSYVPCGN